MIVGITGGTGFIGSRLATRHLTLGDEVRILSRCVGPPKNIAPEIQLYRGDVTGPVDNLLPFVDGLDVLYHCCAEINDTERMYDVHVGGTEKLCSAAAGKIKHWVQLSSVGVYGSRLQGVITENSPFAPVGVYEKTKAQAEHIVRSEAEKGDFSWTILRPSIVYGPEMTNQSLFQWISIIDKGLFFFIGRTDARANYIHVQNVVEALVCCGQHAAAKGKAYNLNDCRSLKDFVAILAANIGRKCPALHVPEKIIRLLSSLAGIWNGFPLTQSRIDALTCQCEYASERIVGELAYHHTISTEDGLREMVSEWRTRQD